MIFYEPHRANPQNGIYHQRNQDLRAGKHLHDSFEWISVEKGAIEVFLHGEWILVAEGNSILIFPNCIHAVRTVQYAQSYLCVFQNSLVNEFYCKIKNVTAENYVFPVFDPDFSKKLEESDRSRLMLKSYLYQLVCEFEKNAGEYQHNRNKPAEHAGQILEYVAGNFSEPITMCEVAKKMGYDHRYLSNLLQKELGTTFRKLLNEYRISHAKHLLITQNLPIVQIAGQCGYESLCSFNRNFRAIEGITPKAYRNGNQR